MFINRFLKTKVGKLASLLIENKVETEDIIDGIPIEERILPFSVNDSIISDDNLKRALNKILKGIESLENITEEQMKLLSGDIELSNKEIVNLKGIEYATNISGLDIGGNVSITDISQLKEMTNLKKIIISKTGINSLDEISELKLKHLEATNIGINTLDSLSNIDSLEYLDISNNNIRSLTPLANLNLLYFLSANNNKIEEIDDINENISSLELNYNNIENITSLAFLTNLVSVSLSHNNIQDISPLTILNRNRVDGIIPKIDISYNKISNIKVLGDKFKNYGIYNKQEIKLTPKLVENNTLSLNLTDKFKNVDGNVPKITSAIPDGKWELNNTKNIITWSEIGDDILEISFSFDDGEEVAEAKDNSNFLAFEGKVIQPIAVEFKDNNLLKVINGIISQKLSVQRGEYEVVDRKILNDLNGDIDLSNKEIKDLGGLEYLDGNKIKSLNIEGNNIINLMPLSNLFEVGINFNVAGQKIIKNAFFNKSNIFIFDISFLYIDISSDKVTIDNISNDGVKNGNIIKWSRISEPTTVSFNYTKHYNPTLAGTVSINLTMEITRGIKLF